MQAPVGVLQREEEEEEKECEWQRRGDEGQGKDLLQDPCCQREEGKANWRLGKVGAKAFGKKTSKHRERQRERW